MNSLGAELMVLPVDSGTSYICCEIGLSLELNLKQFKKRVKKNQECSLSLREDKLSGPANKSCLSDPLEPGFKLSPFLVCLNFFLDC